MKKILERLFQKLNQTSQTEEEKFLSQAVSLEDLERRQKLISHGSAPFQQKYQYVSHYNGRLL